MKELIYDLDSLKEVCEPLTFISESGVDKNEGLEIIHDLKEIMEADKNIIALAAPQIGIKKRVFCIRFNEDIKVFLNPIITKKSGINVGPETFVSMPGKEILIGRPDEVTVVYYNEEFKYEDNKLLGAAARIFDQMAQLLDGVLPSDLGLVSDIEADGSLFDITDEDDQKAILECYKQFIATKTKTYTDEVNSDETDAKLYKKLRFTERVINGQTKIVENDEAQPKNREQRRAEAKIERKMSKKINNKLEA